MWSREPERIIDRRSGSTRVVVAQSLGAPSGSVRYDESRAASHAGLSISMSGNVNEDACSGIRDVVRRPCALGKSVALVPHPLWLLFRPDAGLAFHSGIHCFIRRLSGSGGKPVMLAVESR